MTPTSGRPGLLPIALKVESSLLPLALPSCGSDIEDAVTLEPSPGSCTPKLTEASAARLVLLERFVRRLVALAWRLAAEASASPALEETGSPAVIVSK